MASPPEHARRPRHPCGSCSVAAFRVTGVDETRTRARLSVTPVPITEALPVFSFSEEVVGNARASALNPSLDSCRTRRERRLGPLASATGRELRCSADGAVERRAAYLEAGRYVVDAVLGGGKHLFGDCHLGFSQDGAAATDSSAGSGACQARVGSFSDEFALELCQ